MSTNTDEVSRYVFEKLVEHWKGLGLNVDMFGKIYQHETIKVIEKALTLCLSKNYERDVVKWK